MPTLSPSVIEIKVGMDGRIWIRLLPTGQTGGMAGRVNPKATLRVALYFRLRTTLTGGQRNPSLGSGE